MNLIHLFKYVQKTKGKYIKNEKNIVRMMSHQIKSISKDIAIILKKET